MYRHAAGSRGPDDGEPHRVRERNQRQACQRADAKEGERHEFDVARRREPLTHETNRPDPVGIGASDPVGVVVRVVDADLQAQRDKQREQRESEIRVAEGGSSAGSDEDGGEGSRQGAGARTGNPLSGRSHGRSVLTNDGSKVGRTKLGRGWDEVGRGCRGVDEVPTKRRWAPGGVRGS